MIDLRGEFRESPALAYAFLAEYYEVFKAAFSDTKERPTFDVLREQLEDQTQTDGLRVYAFRVDNNIVGGVHLRIIDTAAQPFGVIEHIWVSPDYQRGGLGGAMLGMTEAVLRRNGAKFCLAEINDPSLMTPDEIAKDAESGISARNRLRFWDKHDFRMIDAPYIQPALHPTEDPVQYLMLGVKSLTVYSPLSLPMTEFSAPTLVQALERFFQLSFTPDYGKHEMIGQFMGAIETCEILSVRSLNEERRSKQVRTDVGH